jgi:serine/threonine protein kinase
MSLTTGTRLGHFEVLAPLGSGGMGEVYRARDLHLGREVALKVLPDAFASDPSRLARFEREARAVAALNHPNVLAVFEVAAGRPPYVVFELLSGRTLRMLLGGPLGVPRAVDYATQIAEGLAAAHEKGIVHRDIKPENLFVTGDGRVKILDFGIATRADEPGDDAALILTAPGTVIGTAGYMAPEQVRGEPADSRADIFALGAVLYEMLTGRGAFSRETGVDSITAILHDEPPAVETFVPDVPPGVAAVVAHCLAKAREGRFQSARDVAFALGLAASPPAAQPKARVRSNRTAIVTLSLAALAFTVPTTLWLSRSGFAGEQRGAGIVVPLSVPPTGSPDSLALSPDGLKIAFETTSDGHSQLWVRFLDTGAARPLPGTENGYRPFWSPDSRSLAFFANGALNRVDIEGGGVLHLAGVYRGAGGTWSPSGTIVLASIATDRVLRIDAGGGVATALKGLDCQSPHFLPDGRRFLCQSTDGIIVADLEGAKPVRLRDGQLAVYGRERELLFVNEGTLFAQDFDPDTLALSGDPQPIAESVATVSSSVGGDVAYRSGTGLVGLGQMVWFDRTGNMIGQVGEPFPPGGGLDLSPDDRYLITRRVDSLGRDVRIWLADLSRGVFSPLTGNDPMFPFWSPDGARVIYARGDRTGTDRNQVHQTWRATGREDAVFSIAKWGVPRDLSADGRHMIVETFDAQRPGASDVLALPLDRTGKLDGDPVPIAATPQFAEFHPQLSPNGRWVAYTSDESGVPEIYVRPFPGPGIAVPVSVGGGGQVRWRAESQELFYLAGDGALMAVPFQATTGEPGVPVRLFATHLWGRQTQWAPEYDVASDGQRFILTVAQPVSAPIWLSLGRATRRR